MTKEERPKLSYIATNENLHAIIKGLDINDNDRILSVGGAGDQAFAMAEHADKLFLVDKNPKQKAYLEKQIEQIKNMDFLSFRKPGMMLLTDMKFYFDAESIDGFNQEGLAQRQKYFSPARLMRIREKIDKVSVLESTVLDALDSISVNKVYLSNIIGYYDSDFNQGSLLFICVNKLPVGGLAYISNCRSKKFDELIEPYGLVKDKHLTGVAQFLERNWKPAVYKRIK